MEDKVEFFQINLHKAHAPTSELNKVLKARPSFIALIQEPAATSNTINDMILTAITNLTNRIDGMESKIITTVDAKLKDFEQDFNAKIAVTEERLDNKIIKLENELQNNVSNFDAAIDVKVTEILNARQQTTEARIDHLERLARANELVISGVPRVDAENIETICSKICDSIGFDVTSVQSCFRVPSTVNLRGPTSPSIIIKFWSLDAKTDFFRSYIAKKNLCVTDIGFSTPARIYINENFTKKNFEIYRAVRQLKADGKIFQYNTYNGRISIKQYSDSRQTIVESKEQLNSLIDPSAAQQQNQSNYQQGKNQPNQPKDRGHSRHRKPKDQQKPQQQSKQHQPKRHQPKQH